MVPLMRRSWAVCFVFVFVARGAVAVAADRGEPPEVDALISQGLELRRQNHPELALPIFEKAYELSQTPRTEGHLGLVLATLDRFLEAEQHLGGALGARRNAWVVKNRPMLEDTLAKVRTHIAQITVDATPNGATVTVGGQRAGTAPLPAPVRVSAGDVEIQVAAAGYLTANRSLRVSGGEHVRVVVGLEKTSASSSPPGVAMNTGVAAAPSAGSTPGGAPDEGQEGAAPSATAGGERDTPAGPSNDGGNAGLRVAAWITGGAALVGIGVGVWYNVVHDNKVSTYDANCTPVSPVYDCGVLYDQAKTARSLSITGYVAGGALAVTSGILFWVSRPKPADAQQAFFTCAPGLTGVMCHGRF